MANDSEIDSWKTRIDIDETGRGDGSKPLRKFTKLIDHLARSAATCENAAYYHTQARSSKSNSEIRYINPAIYTEFFGEQKHDAMPIRTEGDHQQRDHCKTQHTRMIDPKCWDTKLSAIDLPIIHSAMKNMMNIDHAAAGRNTYRCYSTSLPDTTLFLEPPSARSAISSATTAQTERRCRISNILENTCQNEAIKREKYIVDDREVVRISTTASSSNVGSNRQITNNVNLARKIAHAEWIRRKQEAAQCKRQEEESMMKRQQEQEMEIARQKEEKTRLEKESFLKWVEKKKRQELDRRAVLENELELQKRLKEIEDKTAVAKARYLRQWVHKKKEEQKAQRVEQEMRQRKMNEEREKRLEESLKAYEKWRENSKNRPKPATQGLFPHQKAKPTYINPIPWQSIVEIESDETQEMKSANAFNAKKENISQSKR